MNRASVSQEHHATFEGMRQSDADGNEFWLARQLAKALDYSEYRHFLPVVERAKEACSQSGQSAADHFEDVLEMVDIGSGAKRQLPNIRLSRYACYLIVQNGDPSKPVIANGQTYFAIQTRRQELANDSGFGQLSEDEKRLAIRNELAQHNKYQAAAAADAGVESSVDFAIFQNHGYRGLYGGLDNAGIHAKKGLKKARKFSTTWAAPNSQPTSSAPRKPRKNCAAMGSKANSKPMKPIWPLARRCVKPSKNSAAPCRKTCQPPSAASGRSKPPGASSPRKTIE